jgi:hypothetical protein
MDALLPCSPRASFWKSLILWKCAATWDRCECYSWAGDQVFGLNVIPAREPES